MSRLRSVKSEPQGASHIYRESLIDPQAASRSSVRADVKHSSGRHGIDTYNSSGRHLDTECNACGNMTEKGPIRRIPAPKLSDRSSGQDRQEAHVEQPEKRVDRQQPPTLDDVDIEALISSYRPMLHPSVRESLEDQYSVIEASRRERETRLASNGSDEGYSQNRARSTHSPRSGSSLGLQLPSATSNPIQSYFITRSASAPVVQPVASGSNHAAAPLSRSKTSFLSGELSTEHFGDIMHARASTTTMQRAASHSSAKTSYSRSRVPSSGSGSSKSSSSAYVSGSIGRASTSNFSRPTNSRSPLSSPPVSSVPSRFTQSSTTNSGPGSLYASRDANPFFASFGSKKSESVDNSPRSSISSRSNNPSLRWSDGSAQSTSTSRHTPQKVYETDDDVVIITAPVGGVPDLSEEIKNTNSAAFSWLSFDEEDEHRHRANMTDAPGMERKNSLWRESLDSIASSKFDIDDKDDVLARHFPQPPAMLRSNSVATTTTIDASFHTPPEGDESLSEPSATNDLSRASYTLAGLESSVPNATPMERKASISEMLRTHVVSPLSRNRNKSSNEDIVTHGMCIA